MWLVGDSFLGKARCQGLDQAGQLGCIYRVTGGLGEVEVSEVSGHDVPGRLLFEDGYCSSNRVHFMTLLWLQTQQRFAPTCAHARCPRRCWWCPG
jgi:hypothetical protein